MNNKNTGTGRSAVRKGFTLLEMMIVLAIIAVLTAVLVPTITNYLTRSRLNTANANAKVIFNSLQTIMQEYEFNERPANTSLFYGSPKDTTGVVFLANNKGTFTSVSSTTSAIDQAAAEISNQADANSLTTKMHRLFADYEAVSWRALVQGYTVRVVVAADNNDVDYIGCYPGKSTSERGEIAAKLSDVDEAVLRTKASAVWPGISL